ncbi:hypothetical protein [Lentilactobacillus kisonensis]|nr:hypothetical protein [Lentilactobacillus kisonensis]
MKKALLFSKIYILSFIYFILFLFLSHLTPTYSFKSSITPFDYFNALNGLICFPIAISWLKTIINRTRDPNIKRRPNALNRGADNSSYFLAVQTSNATILVPGGYDSVIFRLLLAFFINTIGYIFSVPLLVLLLLSSQFKWHLFETLILAAARYQYNSDMKRSRFISRIDLNKLTELINGHIPALIFIGSPQDRASRLIAPKLRYALKLNATHIFYFNYTDNELSANAPLFKNIGITSLPTLVRIDGNGSVIATDPNYLENTIQLWPQQLKPRKKP